MRAKEAEASTMAIFDAIKAKDERRVKALLDQNPGVSESRDAQGLSPLMMAAYMRASKIVEVLRNAGAPLSIHEAATLGDVQRLERLLAREASLATSPGADGFTPLHLAAHFGHLAAIDALLAEGADINIVSRNYMATVPLISAIAGGQTQAAKHLLSKGAQVHARDVAGNSPLHSAAANGATEIAVALLAAGADVNARSKDGKTPLTQAVEHEEDDMVALLRKAGATT